MLCTTLVHNDMHTRQQFLKMSVGLGLLSVFVRLIRFSILCVFFGFRLDYFVLESFAFVMSVFVS